MSGLQFCALAVGLTASYGAGCIVAQRLPPRILERISRWMRKGSKHGR